MAVVVIEGLLALVLVVAGLREAVMRAVPMSLKLAIGVGIGLFITLVGLREGGIVVNNEATGIALGDLTTGPALIALAGIGVSAVLSVRKVRGAVLLGVLAATALGLIFGVLEGPDGVVDLPELRRLLHDRRRARAGQPRRRAHDLADPGDLRPLHDRLLRHDRHVGGGRPRGRAARRQGRAPEDARAADRRLRRPRRWAARWACRA